MLDGKNLKRIPKSFAGQSCFYKFELEIVSLEPATIQTKVPKAITFDDLEYATGSNALFCSSIIVMLSPQIALKNEKLYKIYKQTTFGILTVDDQKEPFVTIAIYGFQINSLIFYPNPILRSVIDKIVSSLSSTGILLAKLNTGLYYYNQTFKTDANPEKVEIIDLLLGYLLHFQ